MKAIVSQCELTPPMSERHGPRMILTVLFDGPVAGIDPSIQGIALDLDFNKEGKQITNAGPWLMVADQPTKEVK